MVFNESCLDTMARLSEDSVDVVITSPPYNMNLRVRNNKHCSRQITKEFSTKYNGFTDNLAMDEYFRFHKEVLDRLLEISPLVFYNVQLVTGNKQAVFKLFGEFSQKIKDVIIWDKLNAQPAMQFGVLNSQYEMIIIFDKHNAISRQFKDALFERGTLSNVWYIKRQRVKSDVYHGATFSEELVEKILTNFVSKGSKVYDPFAGTGTTGVVAKRLGYEFIGSEIVSSYADLANKRIGVV